MTDEPNRLWATVPDFGPLRGCFKNPRSGFSDIDGIHETNGYFIYMECKHRGDPELSGGQRRALEALGRNPYNTVIVVMLSGDRVKTGALKFEPVKVRNIFGDWADTNLDKFRADLGKWERIVLQRTEPHLLLLDEIA